MMMAMKSELVQAAAIAAADQFGVVPAPGIEPGPGGYLP